MHMRQPPHAMQDQLNLSRWSRPRPVSEPCSADKHISSQQALEWRAAGIGGL